MNTASKIIAVAGPGAPLARALREAVEGWFVAQCRDPCLHFYLYGRPGFLCIAEEPPAPGFTLVSQERVSPAWEKDRAFARLWDPLRRHAVLPPEPVQTRR